MLNYEKFYNIFGISIENRNEAIKQYILDEIKSRQNKLATKEAQIKDLEYERDLVKRDIIDVIRDDLNNSGYNLFYGFTSDLLWKAWHWGNHMNDEDWWNGWSKKKKECEEHKKDCQGAFEFVDSIIREKILKNDDRYEFFEAMDWCFTTAYEFGYRIGDQEIWVVIPVFSNANEKNYAEILCGYAIRYRESEYCRGLLTSNLDYHKVADDLEAWVKEHVK